MEATGPRLHRPWGSLASTLRSGPSDFNLLPEPGCFWLQGPCPQLAASTSQATYYRGVPSGLGDQVGWDRVRHLEGVRLPKPAVPFPQPYAQSPPRCYKGQLEGSSRSASASWEACNKERPQAWGVRSLGSSPSLACCVALDKSAGFSRSKRSKAQAGQRTSGHPFEPPDLMQHGHTFKGMEPLASITGLFPVN